MESIKSTQRVIRLLRIVCLDWRYKLSRGSAAYLGWNACSNMNGPLKFTHVAEEDGSAGSSRVLHPLPNGQNPDRIQNTTQRRRMGVSRRVSHKINMHRKPSMEAATANKKPSTSCWLMLQVSNNMIAHKQEGLYSGRCCLVPKKRYPGCRVETSVTGAAVDTHASCK